MSERNKIRTGIEGAGIGLLCIVSALGCQKTPQTDYVTNKEGQNTLVSSHATEDVGMSIADQLNVPERVSMVSEKTNEYTDIKFAASVRVPDTTALPVYTVAPIEINEERIEDWTNILFDGEVYNYDYGSSEGYQSKEWLESQMGEYEDYLRRAVIVDEVTDGGAGLFDDTLPIQMTQQDYDEYTQQLEELTLQWTTLSDTPGYDKATEVNYNLEDYTAKLSVGFDENENKAYMDYTYSLASFIGIKDEKQYVFSVGRDAASTHMSYGVHLSEELVPGYINLNVFHEALPDTTEPDCIFSKEEAVVLCEEMMSDMGITDMAAQKIETTGMYAYRNGEKQRLGDGYEIWFYRNLGNVSDSYVDSDTELIHFSEPEQCLLEYSFTEYDKENQKLDRVQNREFAYFFVSSDGIIRADWVNPMKIQECQAENVILLDFDTVVNQAMIQLENQYADLGTSEPDGNKKIFVTGIELHYALLQSPYEQTEYTMIPVWDFNKGGASRDRTVVTISAIDGTVFDREEGH